jgi:hypothetical protein
MLCILTLGMCPAIGSKTKKEIKKVDPLPHYEADILINDARAAQIQFEIRAPKTVEVGEVFHVVCRDEMPEVLANAYTDIIDGIGFIHYNWKLIKNSNAQLLKHDMIPQQGSILGAPQWIPGAPIAEIYTFKANKVGVSHLEFQCQKQKNTLTKYIFVTVTEKGAPTLAGQ